MTRTRLFMISTVAIWILGANGLAQTPPDFSGKWNLIPAAATTSTTRSPVDATAQSGTTPSRGSSGRRPGRTGGGFECYELCTIRQTGTTLRIQHAAAPAPATAPPEIVLNLNGVETRTTRPEPGGGPPVESVTKAQWDGDRLLVTRTLGPGLVKIDQVVSLEAGELTIVTTTYVEGTTYGEGPKPIVFKYKKQ